MPFWLLPALVGGALSLATSRGNIGQALMGALLGGVTAGLGGAGAAAATGAKAAAGLTAKELLKNSLLQGVGTNIATNQAATGANAVKDIATTLAPPPIPGAPGVPGTQNFITHPGGSEEIFSSVRDVKPYNVAELPEIVSGGGQTMQPAKIATGAGYQYNKPSVPLGQPMAAEQQSMSNRLFNMLRNPTTLAAGAMALPGLARILGGDQDNQGTSSGSSSSFSTEPGQPGPDSGYYEGPGLVTEYGRDRGNSNRQEKEFQFFQPQVQAPVTGDGNSPQEQLLAYLQGGGQDENRYARGGLIRPGKSFTRASGPAAPVVSTSVPVQAASAPNAITQLQNAIGPASAPVVPSAAPMPMIGSGDGAPSPNVGPYTTEFMTGAAAGQGGGLGGYPTTPQPYIPRPMSRPMLSDGYRAPPMVMQPPVTPQPTISNYGMPIWGAGDGAPGPDMGPFTQSFMGGFAKGGMVRGPGGPTADKVPAVGPGKTPIRLSNGEYIMTAKAVKGAGGAGAMARLQKALEQRA